MGDYLSKRWKRKVFEPGSDARFRVSRSSIEAYIECPRCFYLDKRLGIGRPKGPPFTLNCAVDALLKKEFDAYRAKGEPHPIMRDAGIEAVPFSHSQIDQWRDSLRAGITYALPETNLLLTGGLDDVWVRSNGELLVVDYKATAKAGEVTLDAEWQNGYKRQAEIYQWLLRRNGFPVSSTAYFLYCNGDTSRPTFEGRLEFRMKVLAYEGNDAWVENTVRDLYRCLNDGLPPASSECDHCRYFAEVRKCVGNLPWHP